jgi:hypothetical protein
MDADPADVGEGDMLAVPAKLGPRMIMGVHCDAGHLYHYGCLESLINDIEAYSNKYSTCRQEICSLRNSRPILVSNSTHS